jgi:hypothetical protein
MALAATLGALSFELAGVCYGRVPELDVQPVALAEASELGIARFETGDVFVLDHRAIAGRTARVEYWAPSGPCEGAPTGLLVIADARPGRAWCTHPSGFHCILRA